MITEKNDGMKNSKEKKEIKCKEIAFWRGSNNFFIYKKIEPAKNTEKNICKFITCEDDLVEFSWHYTKYFTKVDFSLKKYFFSTLIHYKQIQVMYWMLKPLEIQSAGI